MVTKILVGFDGSQHSHDSIVLAERLARDTGSELLVATVVHEAPLMTSRMHEREHMQAAADAILAKVDQYLTAGQTTIEKVVLESSSVARGLHKYAEENGVNLLVVGATHHGRLGRLLPGGEGEHLLHHSPCALTIVPTGYAEKATEIKLIGVAFDGSEEAKTALQTGCSLAKMTGSKLSVIAIHEPIYVPSLAQSGGIGYGELSDAARAIMQEFLTEAIAEVPKELFDYGVLLEGKAAEVLAEKSRDDLDLLIIGSRGYGPLRGVVAGSASRELMRTAECPVLVVPRGVPNIFES